VPSRSSNCRMLRIVLYLAAVADVSGQTPAQPAAEPASLSGVVTNSMTGSPVTRAHVTILGGGGLQRVFGAMTSGEGKFTITNVPPGHYSFFAEHVGFVMPSSQDRSLSDMTLGPGDKKEDIKVNLVPTGAISGRVLDAAGEPMQGVSVIAEGIDFQSGSTDDKGQFRIGGLHPGRYRVKAIPETTQFPPEIRTDGTAEVHYSATYYPDALVKKQGTRIEVQAASELTGIDIHLARTPIVGVSGKVIGLPAGAKNVAISAQRTSVADQTWQSAATMKANGSFTFWNLDPGKYTLVATVYSQVPQNRLQSAPVEIEVAGVNLEHIELRMMPPFDIPVQLRFEDEQARQPAQLPGAQRPQQPRSIRLRPILGDRGFIAPGDIGPDDSLTLERVGPEIYHVVLSWRPAYVKSIRVGSVETQGDILDVRSGLTGPVTVLVSSNTCEVHGTVTDSSGPIAGVQVALLQPEAAGNLNLHLGKTDASGAYSISGVPPGKYKLLAPGDDTLRAIERGQGIEDSEDTAESLDLQAGDKIAKDLKQGK
jgi:Carboxypeptidase regulatory-like domain